MVLFAHPFFAYAFTLSRARTLLFFTAAWLVSTRSSNYDNKKKRLKSLKAAAQHIPKCIENLTFVSSRCVFKVKMCGLYTYTYNSRRKGTRTNNQRQHQHQQQHEFWECEKKLHDIFVALN